MFEIGSSLRERRERQQLELSTIEQATRIRAKYLSALEDERFDLLPDPAYAKGFLRTYADYLGLDAQRFVDEYNSRFAPEEEAQAVPAVRVRRQRSLLDPRYAAIPIAALLALIGWRLASMSGRHLASSLPSRGGSSTAQLPTASVRTVTRAAAPVPTTAHVVLRAVRGPCWISVHVASASGQAVYIGTLQLSQTAAFSAPRLWIRIGAPWNLDAHLNGKAVQLRSTVGNVLVTRTGVTPVT